MHRADMAVRRGASRPAAMTCERLLLHLHLAKTGGVTLNDIIMRNLSSGEYLVIEMPPRDESALWTWSNAEVTRALAGMTADAVERIRAVLGHYGPGVQRHLPKPCAVVTILRNPVDRLLSYFYYDVQRGVRSDANLEDFVAQGAELALDNYMTRILSGREELDPRGRGVNLASCRRVTNDDYLAAVSSIDCSMLVGVTERFDEMLVVLASMLGWSLSDLVYERRNVTASRPSAGENSPATRETLVDMNMHDQQLATYAATRLCHQIANYPGDFDSDFLLFGRLNAAHRAGASMAELRFMERAALGPRWRRSPRAGRELIATLLTPQVNRRYGWVLTLRADAGRAMLASSMCFDCLCPCRARRGRFFVRPRMMVPPPPRARGPTPVPARQPRRAPQAGSGDGDAGSTSAARPMTAAQCEIGCVASPGSRCVARRFRRPGAVALAPAAVRSDNDTACARRSATRSNFRSADLRAQTCPSVPFPTFVSFRSTRFYERRKQRDTSKS